MQLDWRHCLYVLPALLFIHSGSASGQSSSSHVPVIGILAWSDCSDAPFERGLRDLGYKPGETIKIECRIAGGAYAGLLAAAQELVRLPVDVIMTGSHPSGRIAHEATDTIPIVSIVSGDPVASGLARSIAKPGGNFTGVSYYATELTAKRLELLKELIPGITKIGVLANPDLSYLPFEDDTKRAAAQFGIVQIVHHVSEPSDLKAAFAAMEAEGAEAVFVLPDVMFAHNAAQIATLALEHHLPLMAWGSWFTEVGGVMAYSADYDQMNYRLASYVDRILRGAKPGDLPIEQPTTFHLSVNLKTARLLELEVPESLLLLADKVFE
jgi:putative tryptophan/tyrosine transport system substrate-binding protein